MTAAEGKGDNLPLTPRIRKPVGEEFDPLDINSELLGKGFSGDRKEAARAKLDLGARSEPQSNSFHLIIENRGSLMADGFREVDFNGRVWELEGLTTAGEMRAKYEQEEAQAAAVAKAKEEEEKIRFITGSATYIGNDISQNLGSVVPPGAHLDFKEESESASSGEGMSEQDQYRGKLTVKLVSPDSENDTILATYFSEWTNQNPANARYYVDQISYLYHLDREKTIESLRKSIKGAK